MGRGLRRPPPAPHAGAPAPHVLTHHAGALAPLAPSCAPLAGSPLTPFPSTSLARSPPHPNPGPLLTPFPSTSLARSPPPPLLWPAPPPALSHLTWYRGYNRAWAGATAIPQPRQEKRDVVPKRGLGRIPFPCHAKGFRVGCYPAWAGANSIPQPRQRG